MNLNRQAAVSLVEAIVQRFASEGTVDLALCPPFVYLETIAPLLKDSSIALGAQNMYFEKSGAFTGEVSGEMLVDVGCHFVILGHSERKAGQTEAVERQQMTGSLAGVSADQMQNIVIAYEPVWAIGTGKVATPEQAQSVHADLRRMIEECYNAEVAGAVRIQYGGSVKPENAKELLSLEDVDGALVGGASLKAEDFLGIVAGAPK